MKIKFGNHEFHLHYSGALYWPEEDMLVVSDLHLEKGSHYARRGYFLPPYDSRATLAALIEACNETKCRRLVLLGDSFHDSKGYHRMQPKEKELFDALKSYRPVWVTGNHDGDFVPDGFSGIEVYEQRGIILRHQAAGGIHEISGHYHPKADIVFLGTHISRPCFIEDGERMILPAFGSYTGGMRANDPVITKIFSKPPRRYILGRTKVYIQE